MEITSISSEKLIYNDNDKRCAPGIDFTNGSCYDIQSVLLMADQYNKFNSSNKIRFFANSEMIDSARYKKYILYHLKNNITECDSQLCWNTQPFMKNIELKIKEKIKNRLRPDGPAGRFEWLDTNNIVNVMKQYEMKYPDFMYLGAVPIDYDSPKLPKGYLKIDINILDYTKLLKEGKSRYGVIFNLDRHDQDGSHWVGLYYDFKKGQIYFFDSYGEEPDESIQRLIRKVGRFMQNELKIKHPDIDYNKLRHQFENSECGVYSINFILRMLKGVVFKDVSTKKVPDRLVNQCRNKYFNNVNIVDPKFVVKE